MLVLSELSILSALARAMALTPKPSFGPPSVDQALSFHLSVTLLSDLEELPSSSKGNFRDIVQWNLFYHISKELKLSEAGVCQTPDL